MNHYESRKHKMKLPSLIVIILFLFIKTTYAYEIDTTAIIQIGGLKQFISIQGKNADNPILLYLHGGPGQAASSYKEMVTGQLEEHFVVVHWDQRNAGKTLELNASDLPITLDLMKKDAEAIFTYLLDAFEREQLTVVAHSWGTVLGFHLADKYPEHIQNFIAISPDVNAHKSQKIALKRLKKHFKKIGDDKALNQLNNIKVPHESIEHMIVQYRWQSVYDGEVVTDEIIEQFMPFFLSWEKTWMPVYKELYDRNLLKSLKELECPVYFFAGKEDFTTNFKITEAYFKKLKAPVKEIFWFNTGHNIPKNKPDLMQKIIIKNVN